MTVTPEPTDPTDLGDARSTSTAGWAAWSVTIVALTALAGLGSWVIGLNPGYTVALVAVLTAASLAWLVVDRRRTGSTTATGAVLRVGVSAVALLVVIQALPMGRDHSNPAVTGEPAWSSPRTRELMVAACYSCHSNAVDWPWYASVAPMSWAISDHVDEGREAVNFSEFATRRGEADESIEVIRNGSMPPAYFTRFGLHSEAVLSPAEQDELIAGLLATPGLGEDEGRGDREHEDEERDEHEDDEHEDDD